MADDIRWRMFPEGRDPVYGVPPLQPPVTEAQLVAELDRLLARENLTAGHDRLLSNILLAGRHPQLAVAAEALLRHPRLWATGTTADALLAAAKTSTVVSVAGGLIFPQITTDHGTLTLREVPAATTIHDLWELLHKADEKQQLLAPLEPLQPSEEEEVSSPSLDSALPPSQPFMVASVTPREAQQLAACSPALHSVTSLTPGSLSLVFTRYDIAQKTAWEMRSLQLHDCPLQLRLRQQDPPICRETLASQAAARSRRWAPKQQRGHRHRRPQQQQQQGGTAAAGQGTTHNHHHHHHPNHHHQAQPAEHVVVVAPTEFPALNEAVQMRSCGYGPRPFVLRPPAELKALCEAMPAGTCPPVPPVEAVGVFEAAQRTGRQWRSDALEANNIVNKLNKRNAAKSGTVRSGAP